VRPQASSDAHLNGNWRISFKIKDLNNVQKTGTPRSFGLSSNRHTTLASATIFSMDKHKEPGVVAVDRFKGDIIVSFADNRDALYSASFLYSSLPLVQELHETEWDSDGAEDPSSHDGGPGTRNLPL
jgi:hypothetical protein